MITTIKLRDLIKYLVGLVISILIGIYSTRYFSSVKNKNNISINTNPQKIIDYTINLANYAKNKERSNLTTSRNRFNKNT